MPKYTQKSLWERLPPSWIRTNPLLNCPTFLRIIATKRANAPHTGDSKNCQYGDKAPLKPHISQGGGGGLGFTLTGALARANERLQVRNERNVPQAKLDSEINVPFLLNEHGDLYILLVLNDSVHRYMYYRK